MAKALGIDIGSHAVKVAVVDGGPKGARLVRYAEVPYDGGAGGAASSDAVVAALKKALTESRGPRQAASYAFPAEQCILREITVPFETEDQIAKVIKFEFEPHLHAGAIEDVVLDFLRTGPARQGSRVLCIAAQKAVVRERLDDLAEVGVDPLHMDVDVAALFNVAKQSGALDEHPNCLVIDIGARTTKAVAVRDGQLRVARSIRLGARGAEKQIEAQLQGDADAAKHALEAAGTAEGLAAAPAGIPTTLDIVNSVQDVEAAVARAVQDDFLSRVLRETQRSLPSAVGDKPLTQVFLTGGGAAHPRARERISAHFGVPVSDLPVLGNLEHKLPPSEAQRVAAFGAVAVGTALKVVGIDYGAVDLRKEEFRFSRTFDRVKTALAIGSTFLFFAVFLLFLTSWLQHEAVRREAKGLREAMHGELAEDVVKAYQASVPSPRKAPAETADPSLYFRRTRAYVTVIRDHLKNELGLATEVPPIRSCLELWAATTTAIQEARQKGKIEYLLVKEERYDQLNCSITVIVGDLPDGQAVVDALRKRVPDLFEKVANEPPRRTKDGKYYEITIKLEVHERTGEKEVAANDAAVKPEEEAK